MTAANPSIRDYDKARMQRIAAAFWKSLLVELRDEEGTVYMPLGEIMDASALMLGVLLSSAPEAKVPSKLREYAAAFAKNLVVRTRQAAENPGSAKIFDVVMSEPGVGH